MVCIHCDSPTQVINSRLLKRTNHVWRRRRCLSCGNTFTTHETAEFGGNVVVRRPGRELVPFSRDTLFISIYEGCKHRPDASSNASNLTRTVLGLLRTHIDEGVLDCDVITTVTATALERFDPTAGTVYKAYHPPHN